MKHTLLMLALAVSALAQTALTNEEKLALENASLKLQLIEAQKADIQKAAQGVFESACKRAGIELSTCQFDQKTLSVSKAEAPKTEVKK